MLLECTAHKDILLLFACIQNTTASICKHNLTIHSYVCSDSHECFDSHKSIDSHVCYVLLCPVMYVMMLCRFSHSYNKRQLGVVQTGKNKLRPNMEFNLT